MVGLGSEVAIVAMCGKEGEVNIVTPLYLLPRNMGGFQKVDSPC